MQKKTLNIGAGTRTYKHYPTKEYDCINIDERDLPGIDYIVDAWDLTSSIFKPKWHNSFVTDEFDYILASGIIEHFPIAQTENVLTKWMRVLKPGGIIEFKLPNLRAIADSIRNGSDSKKKSCLLYGNQDYPGNFHYVCFDRKFFNEEINKVGLTEIEYCEEGFNMIIIARKK